MTKPHKYGNSHNRWTEGLVWSKFQKVQIIKELAFLYASFMLYLCCCLGFLYTDYAFTNKWCYMDFIILSIFYTSPNKLCYVTTMYLCLFHALMLLWFSVYFMLI